MDKINPKIIEKFLNNFPNHVIQYFTDDKNAVEEKRMAKTAQTFSLEEAKTMQKQGCGVYFSINGFRNGKRVKENLANINAVFVDLDVAKEEEPLPENDMVLRKTEALNNIKDAPLQPHFVAETKNGFHALWLADDIKNENQFLFIVKGLADYFKADKGGLAINKVLRLPGFYHLKNPKHPFLCSIVINNSDLPKYSASEIIQKFDLDSSTNESIKTKSLKEHRPDNSGGASPEIQEALKLPIDNVIKMTASMTGIKIDFKSNGDGSQQIIENSEMTSGFISSKGEFVHSSSGKNRKGNQLTVAEYYLNEIGGYNYNRQQIAELLIGRIVKDENKPIEIPDNKPLPIVTLSDFIALNIPKIDFLIKNLLPERGISMIQGHPGTFKTWLALYFIYCIIHDKKVFEVYDVKPVNVLIVEVDDYLGLLQDRMEKVGFKKDHNNSRIHIWNSSEFNISGEEDQLLMNNLIEFVKENNIGLIIFDTFREIHRLDENKSEEMQKIMKVLKKIADHCSVILLHHLGKEYKSSLLNVRGSTAILGSLISSLNLTWREDEKALKITQTKNKMGPLLEPFLIKFQTEQCGENLFRTVEATKKPDIEKIKELIKEFYSQNPKPEMTKSEFITHFSEEKGFPKNTVKVAFEQAINENIIRWDEELRSSNKKFYILNEIPKNKSP